MAPRTPAEPIGPGDHGPKYNRQLIVALLGEVDNPQTLRQAEALDGKRREPPLLSEVVSVRCQLAPDGHCHAEGLDALQRALAGQLRVAQAVGGRSRVYLLGDCRAADRTLAGWSGDAVAGLIADAGLREVALISIVGDGAGRDPAREEHTQADAGAHSFASALHRTLWEAHHVCTTVHARTGSVRVLEHPLISDGVLVEVGRKVTEPVGGGAAAEHHATHSKLRLWWDASGQRCDWAY